MRFSNVLAFLLLPLAAGVGQDLVSTMRWFGDIRVRGEIDMRDFRERTPANGYTLLRTRLGVEARPVEGVRVLIQVRDSRTFGQERDATNVFNTLADSRNLDLHQGFVEIRNILSDALTLTLGRQELVYGNERLIGAVGWNNVGRVFDGGVLRLSTPMFTLDALAMTTAEVQSSASAATPSAVQYVRDGGSDLYGVYGMVTPDPDHKVDGYVLYQSDRNQTVAGANDLSRWTLGGLARGNLAAVNYDLEAAYQFGNRRGADVSAYLIAASVHYTLGTTPLLRIGTGYDILSGTKTGSSRHGSFDPMFHTGHKFYGFMDYFIGFPAHTTDRGLRDLYVRGMVGLTEDLTAGFWLHEFRPDTDGRLLGHELESVVVCKLNKALQIEWGVAAFLPGVVMRDRFAAAGTAFWGYCSVIVAFSQ